MDSQYGRPHSHKVSFHRAQEIESHRSKHAIEIDKALQAKEQFRRGLKDYSDWASNPSRSDIQTIDSARNLPPMRREVITRREFEKTTITPLTKRLYGLWHDQYLRDKMNGIRRKPLTELSLQKYLGAREKAFDMEGGSPDAFRDRLDEVDFAVASDSWSDLNPELEKAGLFYDNSSEEELVQRAREERRYDREYTQFLREVGHAG